MTHNTTKQTVNLVEVVVTRPDRVIDLVFDIWLWFYSGLAPFIMGILTEKQMIKKMLRSGQKPVGLTYICQFLVMPLVNKDVVEEEKI